MSNHVPIKAEKERKKQIVLSAVITLQLNGQKMASQTGFDQVVAEGVLH